MGVERNNRNRGFPALKKEQPSLLGSTRTTRGAFSFLENVQSSHSNENEEWVTVFVSEGWNWYNLEWKEG